MCSILSWEGMLSPFMGILAIQKILIFGSIEHHRTQKLLQVLHDFGFGALDISADDFLRPEYTIQLGYPPNRIDVLTSLKGVEFEMCYANKERRHH